MINENFVIFGFVLQALGSLKYIIETLKGRVKPNRVTFFLWALAPLIAFAAEIKEGVGIQSLMTFGIGFFPLLILIASFVNKKAEWKLGTFDYICGFLSLIGLALWYVTKNGNTAIAFAIIADALAALPTIVKAYKYPETESMWAYLATFISAVITVSTIKVWNFAHYAFPIDTVLINLLMFSLIQFKIGKVKSA